jgi:hypothetical protein
MKTITTLLIILIAFGTAFGEEIKMPTVPDAIKNEIKKAARAKWPGNYEMQLFHYENNLEAWQMIQLIRGNLIRPSENETEKVINEEMSQIFKKAEKKWPGNYEMQLFQIKNQVEAFMKMEGVE